MQRNTLTLTLRSIRYAQTTRALINFVLGTQTGGSKIKTIKVIVMSLLLVTCASILVQHDYDSSLAISKNEYLEHSSKKGVVLLAINWNRYWNCGGFENAELRSFGFDFMPKRYVDDEHTPDFVVNGTAGKPGFMNYAFLLEPGEYAISYTSMKIAKSVSDVSIYTVARSHLFESGNPKGGSFEISAGEVVYIGHFGLDCTFRPMMWRYYAENKDSFLEFVASYKPHYPFLQLDEVQYRLFKTKEFGYDFHL